MTSALRSLALAVVLGALAYGHGQAEIVVPAGETQTIPPGLQRITRLELRSGSTLVVSGTTTILSIASSPSQGPRSSSSRRAMSTTPTWL